jgi:RNA polymerase sigma-70 factor (ECF subfamily)
MRAGKIRVEDFGFKESGALPGRNGGKLFLDFCIFTEREEDRVVPTGGNGVHTMSDDQLVLRAQEGEEAAFGELYRRHRTGILRFCARLLGNNDEAADALQSSFLKARESIGSLRSPGMFRAWLLQIARNEVYGMLRRNRNNGVRSLEDPLEEKTPLDELLQKECRSIAEALLSALKPEYREVLILREYERLSYAEIARVTGESDASVRTRIFKARKALVRQYHQRYE